MAGLAVLEKALGREVSGCDVHPSPRTEWLESLGVRVFAGHSAEHVRGAGLVVVTPAVRGGTEELESARASARVRYRGEVLAEIVSSLDGVSVCGTHGKTTTATFTAKLLSGLGDDPGWCIGGETGAMPVAFPGSAFSPPGGGRGPFVAEADESDGTLALYSSNTLVVNAVDFDHLEHFAGAEAYFDCYRRAVANTRRCVVACADHEAALSLACGAKSPAARLVTFGLGGPPALPDGCTAAFHVCEGDFPELRKLVRGDHNVRNALAAAAVAMSRGHPAGAVARALPRAVGELPDRRFEMVCESPALGVAVFTDYAHHPAELACAVGMAASLGAKRVRVVFQPHRYSRTKALLREFPPAFALADEVVLAPVYPAFEDPLDGGKSEDLLAAFAECAAKGGCGPARLSKSPEAAWSEVFGTLRPGDVVLIAGAGDIVDILPRIREDMRLAQTRGKC